MSLELRTDVPHSQTIEVLQDALIGAVEYASHFRAYDHETAVEACERAIRYANMLSHAIVALSVAPEEIK